ncbi:hypothetical protein PO909_006626 [Leuciscus waleckii]
MVHFSAVPFQPSQHLYVGPIWTQLEHALLKELEQSLLFEKTKADKLQRELEDSRVATVSEKSRVLELEREQEGNQEMQRLLTNIEEATSKARSQEEKRSTRIAGSGEKPRRLRKHLQRDESSLKSLAAPPSIAFLLRYPAPISFTLSVVATLSDGDCHVICVSCLVEDHAALALADGGCHHCELLPMATLRTRLAYFTETAPPPAVVPRRKKRRAQRVPEPSPTRQSSQVRPPASPASSVSLPDGQRPPLPSMTLMRKPHWGRMIPALSWHRAVRIGRAL